MIICCAGTKCERCGFEEDRKSWQSREHRFRSGRWAIFLLISGMVCNDLC